jgi:DNA repair ATPase RecN
MSLLDQIKGDMSNLEETVTNAIPGYKGYKQKELRREADKLLRDTLADRMRTLKIQLDELQKDLISGGKFDLLDEVESVATQLQTFIDRVKTASYGYSGLFDAKRVKEEDLDRLYEFDAHLMDYVERIEGAIQNASENIDGEEVGNTAVYLLSDLASGVTGELIHVDAGYSVVGL